MTTLGTVVANSGYVHPFWFNTEIFKTDYVVTGDTQTTIIEDDKEVSRYTNSSISQRASVQSSIAYSITNDDIDYSYSIPQGSPVTVSNSGIIEITSPTQPETVDVTISGSIDNVNLSRVETVQLNYQPSSILDTVSGYVSGTAREALTEVIESAISTTSETAPTPVYSTLDYDAGTFVRNSNFLLNSTHRDAVTCASPWNSRQGAFRAGTAVTPRHVLVATHYPLAVGDTIKFVTSDDTVISRTITRKVTVKENSDIDMLLLDSDLPATITPCKLFPSNYEDYLPAGTAYNSYAATSIPLLTVNARGEKASVRELLRITITDHGHLGVQVKVPEPTSSLYPFYEPTVVGDSGSPVFAVIGSELWLMNLWWSGGGGTFLASILTELNSAISSLDASEGISTGYTVTEGDLSSYTDFS